jgi:crotonobetainyl-CoA:carnitine CoA-transferase CaiB-like acyl-CoA transferase
MISPLEGVRVLDLGLLAPGPYCSMLLADFGADVVVLERVPAPGADRDELARAGARFALGRNKRSLCLDLKQPDGVELFRRLAREADVVIEGFRPGVVARLGIDYATLRSDCPRLVYCSLSGYGQTGPYATRAGHDLNYIALAGALGMIGRPGAPPSIPMNLLADYAGGGLLAAFAIMLALFARDRSGGGQYIDVAMTDGVLSLLTKLAGQYFERGSVPEPGRHRINGGSADYDVYACADGRFMAVGALEPHFFERLCGALGVDPDDPELAAAFARQFRTRSRNEWTLLLADADACAAPVLGLDEALRDPHHAARGMIASIEHPRFGTLPAVGVAPKLSLTPGSIRRPPPAPGEHTDELLGQLGLEPHAIEALRARRVVG